MLSPEIPRPKFLQPPVSLNDYLRMKQKGPSLQELSLRDYRELMDRKLPNSAWKDVFLEPLMTPEQRKKKMESMSRKQKADYLENLTKANMSAAKAMEARTTKKYRINKEVLKHVRKAKREHRIPED